MTLAKMLLEAQRKLEEPQSIAHIDQEFILAIAAYYPEINDAVRRWNSREITWEQAMYLAIYSLAKEKASLMQAYRHLLEENSPPTIIKKGSHLPPLPIEKKDWQNCPQPPQKD